MTLHGARVPGHAWTIRSDEQVPFLPIPASYFSLRTSRPFSGLQAPCLPLAGFLLRLRPLLDGTTIALSQALPSPCHHLGTTRQQLLWHSWTLPCESKNSLDRVSFLPGVALQAGPSNDSPWATEFLFSPCLTKLLLFGLRQVSSGQKVQHWPECPQGC